MSIQALKDLLPEYAKDIKINLGNLAGGEPVEGLTLNQAAGIAAASAFATKHPEVIRQVTAQVAAVLSEAELRAAKAAATVMAMNNVYYRFVHLVEDKAYAAMPAGLRMTMIAAHGIAKTDFELMSLAVSAVNGCGMCMEAHVREAEKHGTGKQGVQACVKIAAVINAAAQALRIEEALRPHQALTEAA